MSLKKYIREEIEAVKKNIDTIEDCLKSNNKTPLQKATLLQTKETLLFVIDIFKDEHSDSVLVENIYNKLPLINQQLVKIIKDSE